MTGIHPRDDLRQPGTEEPSHGRNKKKILVVAAAGAVLLAAAGTTVALLSGGPALAASPAQISSDLVGYTTGSPYPIFVIKHAQVIGTPKDNGKTETADVNVSYGLIPGASGTVPPPQEVAFTLNDKTKSWSYKFVTNPSYSGTVTLVPGRSSGS